MHLMPLLAFGFIGAGFRAFIYKNYTTDRKISSCHFNHTDFYVNGFESFINPCRVTYL